MTLLRRSLVLASLLVAVVLVASGRAQSVPPVEVVEVSGPIDRTLVDYVEGVIDGTDAQLVVLSVDAPGAIDGDVVELMGLIADPPVPVAVWIGPAPAVAPPRHPSSGTIAPTQTPGAEMLRTTIACALAALLAGCA